MKGWVCTIGFFDGVHLGHQVLLSVVNDIKKKNNFKSVIYTFNKVAKVKEGLIYPVEEKIRLLHNFGADKIKLLDFDKVKNLSPSEFFKFFILENKISILVAGVDFRFGKGASGDVELLNDLCKKNQITCIIVEDFNISFNGKRYFISSSLIRENISLCNFSLVEKLLGREYYIKGKITEGNKIGSKIGIPTINVLPEPDLLLPKGVIAGFCKINDVNFPAVANFGLRPTVDGKKFIIEVHIIDGEIALLDTDVIQFRPLKKIRDEKKFSSLLELKKQILKDKQSARLLFKQKH